MDSKQFAAVAGGLGTSVGVGIATVVPVGDAVGTAVAAGVGGALAVALFYAGRFVEGGSPDARSR